MTGAAFSAALGGRVHLRRLRSDDRDVSTRSRCECARPPTRTLSVLFRNTDDVDLKPESENQPIIPWPLNTPIVAGPEMRRSRL